MDLLWNCLGIFCLCLSLFMIIYSVCIIAKERRRLRRLLAAGEKVSPWYTNVSLCKYVSSLFDGILLAGITISLALFLRHVTSALLLLSVFTFLSACSTLVKTVFEEIKRRNVAQGTQARWPYRQRSSRFHQEIAITIFQIGISIITLLNGLVSIKVLSFESVDQMIWLWMSLMLLGGVYWLVVSLIHVLNFYRYRS